MIVENFDSFLGLKIRIWTVLLGQNFKFIRVLYGNFSLGNRAQVKVSFTVSSFVFIALNQVIQCVENQFDFVILPLEIFV